MTKQVDIVIYQVWCSSCFSVMSFEIIATNIYAIIKKSHIIYHVRNTFSVKLKIKAKNFQDEKGVKWDIDLSDSLMIYFTFLYVKGYNCYT